MECFLPAQATGDALYQVFTNSNGANPAGRLPMTWPASMNQVGITGALEMVGASFMRRARIALCMKE